jgi:cyclophilin family peptidyl-prolyl cis-trans isomerase
VRGDGSGGDSIYGGKFNDEKGGLKLKHDGPGVVGAPGAAARPCAAAAAPGRSSANARTPAPQSSAPQNNNQPRLAAMANGGKNTNTSQFFVTLAAAPQCDGKHVVLGRVVEGLELVARIGVEAATPSGAPALDVVIGDCGLLP